MAIQLPIILTAVPRIRGPFRGQKFRRVLSPWSDLRHSIGQILFACLSLKHRICCFPSHYFLFRSCQWRQTYNILTICNGSAPISHTYQSEDQIQKANVHNTAQCNHFRSLWHIHKGWLPGGNQPIRRRGQELIIGRKLLMYLVYLEPSMSSSSDVSLQRERVRRSLAF